MHLAFKAHDITAANNLPLFCVLLIDDAVHDDSKLCSLSVCPMNYIWTFVVFLLPVSIERLLR
jgi:hypothetical protein